MQTYPVCKELMLNNLDFIACDRILAKKYVNLKELKVDASMGTVLSFRVKLENNAAKIQTLSSHSCKIVSFLQ